MTSVLFIGPGAIASLLCWHIQAFTRPLVLRHRLDLTLSQAVIHDDDEYPLRWSFLPRGSDFRSIDLVIVCCKTGQVETAVTPLIPLLDHAHWLICCNGLGPQQWLAEQLPGRVLWGSTTEGALNLDRRSIKHTGRGETHIGPAPGSILAGSTLADRTREMGQWLCRLDGPLTLEWDDEIESRLWLKLAINAVINPITAVEGVANGALTSPDRRNEIERLCGEIRSVAQGCGQTLPADLAARVTSVAHRTANNRSSMLGDIEVGRATEIEFINGYLIRQATKLEIPVPRLTYWYRAVQALSRGSRHGTH